MSYKGLEEVERAFSYAIKNINDNQTILYSTTLVPEIKEMESPEDSPSAIIRDSEYAVIIPYKIVYRPFITIYGIITGSYEIVSTITQ